MASTWIHTALMLPLSGLAAAALLAHRTPDLKEVQASLQKGERALPNLPTLLEQTVAKQGGPLELTESEINEYIARRIKAEQKGLSARFAKPEQVLIDMDDNLCRVHVGWSVLGHRTGASVEFALTRQSDHFEIEIKRGDYGTLQVPRGLLPPLIPAMQEIVHAFQPEIDALFKMPHIRFAKNKLLLDPKF